MAKKVKETEPIVELIGFTSTERMQHTDGYAYDRHHFLDDTIGGTVEWYNEACVGISEDLVNDELAEELEAAYQKSKQGFFHCYKKTKK